MAKQTIEVDVPEGFAVSGGFVLRNVRMDGSAIDGHIPLRKVEPVRESRWINAYRSNYTNEGAQRWVSRELAIANQGDTGAPLIRIDYENARPVSASIEEA